MQNSRELSHLHIIPPLSDIRKMRPVWTVQDKIRRYPLVSVLSSLSINPWELHRPSHINLKKLVMIVIARRPSAHQTATASPVKSCQPWCVIVIPSRRGRHSRVSYATILDSNRAVTELLCADKKHYINKVLADCWLAISALAHTYTRRSVLPLASAVNSRVDNRKWDLSSGAMTCWWVLLMRKQLSMAATAGWYGCAHT